MIYHLSRKELDVEKYNVCITNSVQSRIYAYSWYLDVVADNWDVLVLNDYEAVMPLPWRSKYWINYIYPPSWIQQLGIFSAESISENLTNQFINSIPRKFKKVTLQFNAGNILSKFSKKKINYVLNLNDDYSLIASRFNKNRKRELIKVKKECWKIDKNLSQKDFLKFYKNEKLPYSISKGEISTLSRLLNLNSENICIWGIKENQEILSAMVWLKDDFRLTYLLPVTNSKAKNKGLPTFLVSELIAEYSNSNYVLDFEGSMIPGVASFYRSFGATKESYFLFKKWSV